MEQLNQFVEKKNIPGQLSDDKLTWNFPNIITTTSKGQKRNYLVFVQLIQNNKPIQIIDDYTINNPDNTIGYVRSISGVINMKQTMSKPEIIKTGKNIGKINQTSILTQSLINANTRYNTQLKKVLKRKNEDVISRYAPMLAKRIETVKNINYLDGQNYYLQRKRDGVRGMAYFDQTENQIFIYSRRRDLYFGIPHIIHDLQNCLLEHKNYFLDGEIYLHGEHLQDISGTARKDIKNVKNIDQQLKLEFWIFDLYDKSNPDLTYNQRLNIINELFDFDGQLYNKNYIKKVETYKINTNNIKTQKEAQDKINNLYQQFLDEGYEGAILRKGNSVYKVNYRSSDLLKIKPVFHDEFKCVNFTEGKKGLHKGTIIYTCETNKEPKKLFNVKVKGFSLDKQKEIFQQMSEIQNNNKTYFENNYKNKFATIEYLDLSKDGKPQKAYFINFRDDL